MMKEQRKVLRIDVLCPDCGLVIENVTAEAMVYCRTCRKWCREKESLARAATTEGHNPKPKRQRPPRCH
ncbi:MAG: hypothetical protein U0Z53_04405 [Blastocatellia bacterium]